MLDKEPPNDPQIEQSVIAALLTDRSVRAGTLDLLQPDDFYTTGYRLAYTAIRDLVFRGTRVDHLTVATVLKRREQLEEAGGPTFLKDLADTVAITANCHAHAEVIKHLSTRRKLAHVGHRIMQNAYGLDIPAEEAIEISERELYAVSRGQFVREASTTASLTPAVQNYAAWRAGVSGATPTHFADLDELLVAAGMIPGELFVLGARPSVGKTALALAIARNVAEQGQRVVFFSIEMSKQEIMTRLWAMQSRLSLIKLIRHRLDEAEYGRLLQAQQAIAAMPLLIEDNSSISVAGMRSLVRREQSKGKVGLVVIDYLQEMDNGTTENETVRLARLVKAIKAMAKDQRVPTMLLSQLKRTDGNHEPTLSDLRGSGGIEQTADVAVLLHSDLYHLNHGIEYRRKDSPVKVIMDKQRNGPTGVVYVMYRPECTRFDPTSSSAAVVQEDEEDDIPL